MLEAYKETACWPLVALETAGLKEGNVLLVSNKREQIGRVFSVENFTS